MQFVFSLSAEMLTAEDKTWTGELFGPSRKRKQRNVPMSPGFQVWGHCP